MKMITFQQPQYRSQSLLAIPLVALGLLAVMAIPSYASGKPIQVSAASKSPPAVALPYTFTCPHCSMKITIKTPADWKKDCMTCACGTTNLGCYNEKKK